VAWTASTDNVAVAGYRVERCTGAGCTNFAQVGTPTSATFVDTGLSPSTSYSYRVLAVDSSNNLSGYSNIATATTASGGDTTPPSAPSGLTATAAGQTQVNLTWTASTDNVGVTGYQVERCAGATCTNFAQVGTSTTASFSSTGLTANTTYRFRVLATDAAGNLSGYSNIATATTAAGPPPPVGLVAGYTFDAGSGSTLADASGNGNNGTISGATWVPGKYGGALSFNGSSDRVSVPASASLNLTSAMTLAAWIEPTASQSGWRTIVQRETDSYALNASNSNGPLRPSGAGTFGGAFQWVSGPSANPVNAWTHVAVTYDGTTLRLYVNGTQVASTAAAGTIESSTNPLWIGGNSPYGEYFQGLIDEARVYNRVLSATEVQTAMNTPLS